VGILEKSRRWRMARIAMLLSRLFGFDIFSPGAWLEARQFAIRCQIASTGGE
jgi:hypothetical protein